MPEKFDNFKAFLKKFKTTYFFLFLLLLLLILFSIIDNIWIENGYKNKDFIFNLIVELHGVLGDVLIFGIILSIYDIYKEKKDNIGKWTNEIDDFRDWNEKEAKFRIYGNVRRLQKEKCFSLDLSRCFLIESFFEQMKFVNTNFGNANLSDCNFKGAVLKNCNFKEAKLINADFSSLVPFIETQYSDYTILSNVNFSKADLTGANFIDTPFDEGVNIVDAILDNVMVDAKWYSRIKEESNKRYIDENYSIEENKSFDWVLKKKRKRKTGENKS